MEQIVGLATIPMVRELVKQLNLSGILALLASIAFACVFNFAIAMVSNADWKIALAYGLVTAFGANIYHDVKSNI